MPVTRQDPVEIDREAVVGPQTLDERIKALLVPGGQPPTTVLLYFSGHAAIRVDRGRMGLDDSRAVCLASGTDPYAVPLIDLLRAIDKCDAREVVVWLDCCYSGELVELAEVIGKRPGLLLASSAPREPSYESRGRHGLFSEALIAALTEGSGRHSQVTAAGLVSELERRLTGQIQTFKGALSPGIILFQRTARRGPGTRDAEMPAGYLEYLGSLVADWQGRTAARVDPSPQGIGACIRVADVYLEPPLVEADEPSAPNGTPSGGRPPARHGLQRLARLRLRPTRHGVASVGVLGGPG